MCSDANLVRSWDFHSLGREYAYKWREQLNRKLCFSFRRILEMNMNFRFYFDAGYWFLVRMTCHFKSDFHRTKNIQRAKKKSVEYSMNIYSVRIEIEIQINPSSGRTRKCNPKRWNMYHRSHLNRLDVFSVFAIFCRKMPFSVQRETKRHTNTKQKPLVCSEKLLPRNVLCICHEPTTSKWLMTCKHCYSNNHCIAQMPKSLSNQSQL